MTWLLLKNSNYKILQIQLLKPGQLGKVCSFVRKIGLIHILEERWDIPWSVALEVNIINELRSSLSARVEHSLKEGNTLADYFIDLVFILQVITNSIILRIFQAKAGQSYIWITQAHHKSDEVLQIVSLKANIIFLQVTISTEEAIKS